MKTARFSQIVERCGAPAVHLAWVAPEKDTVLKKALKQHRVMTIHQTVRGTSKDFGTVGLLTTPGAQIVIFPRSLEAFSDRRIVGINYGLFAEAAAKAGIEKRPAARAPEEKLKRRAGQGGGKKPAAHAAPVREEKVRDEPVRETEEAKVVTMTPEPLSWEEARAAVIGVGRTLKRGNIDAARARLKKLAEQMERAGPEARA